MEYNDDEIEQMMTLVCEIQYEIKDLARLYCCWDLKVMTFYNMPTDLALSQILDSQDEDPDALLDQLVNEFLAYYEVSQPDTRVVYDLVCKLARVMRIPVKISFDDLCEKMIEAQFAFL